MKKSDSLKESVHTDGFSEYARFMTCVSDTVIIYINKNLGIDYSFISCIYLFNYV